MARRWSSAFLRGPGVCATPLAWSSRSGRVEPRHRYLRLGLSAGWAGYLGDDEPGQLVLDRIRAEGVDTSQVSRIKERRGLYLREQIGTDVRVYYYRRGSAASTMRREAFDPDYFSGAGFVHLTGITPALSGGCRAFVLWVAREARASGARLSFDVNYRSKLWGAEEAREFVEEILPDVDLLLAGDEEARAIWGRDDEGFVRDLAGEARMVVLKRGGAGSLALVEGEIRSTPPSRWRRSIPWEPATPSPPDTSPAICGACQQKSACAWRTRWAHSALQPWETTKACPTRTSYGLFSKVKSLWEDEIEL